jgi:D-sedoheptulose 7-phosphate isomerase
VSQMEQFLSRYFSESAEIARTLDQSKVEQMVEILFTAREKGGRLFILGVGGSAGNAGHAVNDFRKICGIETYAPTDNVSELTARTNDEGWDTSFSEWLRGSRVREDDVVLVFSVGGGNLEKNVSTNIVKAVVLAKKVGAKVIGVVGRDGGYTAQVGDAVAIVPTMSPDLVTPHSEAFQAVVWHGIVSHPRLKQIVTKWESL